MLVMCQTHKNGDEKAFSIIEMLVVLVIVGLLTAVVAPNAFTWLRAANNASVDSEVRAMLGSLPLNARLYGKRAVLDTHQDISHWFDDILQPLPTASSSLQSMQMKFEPTLYVASNGFCGDSTLTLIATEKVVRRYQVNSPYCQVNILP